MKTMIVKYSTFSTGSVNMTSLCFNNQYTQLVLPDLVAPAMQKVEHASNGKGIIVKLYCVQCFFYKVNRLPSPLKIPQTQDS